MIATLQLSAQSYNYSYTDPCTGQLKTLSVPINGSVAISYYGQIQNFSPAELQNGTFANWTSSVYNEFGGNNPCATLVGLPTAINITQGTVYTTIGIINSLTTLADFTSSIPFITLILQSFSLILIHNESDFSDFVLKIPISDNPYVCFRIKFGNIS